MKSPQGEPIFKQEKKKEKVQSWLCPPLSWLLLLLGRSSAKLSQVVKRDVTIGVCMYVCIHYVMHVAGLRSIGSR